MTYDFKNAISRMNNRRQEIIRQKSSQNLRTLNSSAKSQDNSSSSVKKQTKEKSA